MAVVYEVSVRAGSGETDSVRRWFDSGPAKRWRGLARLAGLDAYFPCLGLAQDPYVNDGLGPAVVAMLSFPDEQSLWAAVRSSAFEGGLADLPPGASVTADALLRRFYSAHGETDEQAFEAAFSYVVRYHRPARNEQEFVDNYLTTHPALLATLPHVRTVLCYIPIAGDKPKALPSADYMIGNEVAFDSIDHFNVAMASPVRHELRRHYYKLPTFTGRNTHYAMDRVRLR